MDDDLKYECRDNTVVFRNNVTISRQDLDALFKVKHQVTCMPSFIWSELLRLKEDQDSLTVRFRNKRNFERKEKALEILRDSDYYKMEKKEVLSNNSCSVELRLTEITPEFKSIIPLI